MPTNLMGVDVGFSVTRPTTGIALLDGDRLHLVRVGTAWESREAQIPTGFQPSIVEDFPNAFLGVLMPEVELLAAPKFKRGRRFDWLYERLVTTERLKSLLSKTLDLPEVFWHRLSSETNHEKRAALICLLTAAVADKGTASSHR
jgi:hypothetical protein